MYVWTGPWAVVREPTPLLRKLTGEFADRIATLWPAPHGAFLIAPSARRHLICLALARAPRSAEALEPALTAPLKPALRALLPDAPPGLARALERMGEEAWTAEGYGQLLAVLADPDRAKTINHAKALTPEDVAIAAGLPLAIVRAGGGRVKLDAAQASVLRAAYDAIVARVGPAQAEAVAERWGRARSARTLFDWAAEDIVAEIPPPALPPAPGLRVLASKADFREAAIRFRNCLRTQIVSASTGDSVYYEWLGPPAAIVQVSRDPVFGWRLSEVRAPDNDVVPEHARGPIIAALESMGVAVGPSHWTLSHALDMAGRGQAWPMIDEAHRNEAFE